jgi:rSAM/selenodomain-associated transferase 1
VNGQILVLAKAPVPGRVKTRLCPPCTPGQAAAIAAAALADTLDCVSTSPAARRCLVLAGSMAVPDGWSLTAQRDGELGARLAHAFADTALSGVPSLLIGMDTPQVTPALLGAFLDGLAAADAVLGPAQDGGWWALALREPGAARVLADVPTSREDTGARTVDALRGAGLRVAVGETLRDVDTAADARAVVAACRPGSAFAAAVRTHLPADALAGGWTR